jgi:hypothetical protein
MASSLARSRLLLPLMEVLLTAALLLAIKLRKL